MQENFDEALGLFHWLDKYRDRSVTELEFLHGHLNHPGNLPTYICFRDKVSNCTSFLISIFISFLTFHFKKYRVLEERCFGGNTGMLLVGLCVAYYVQSAW